MLEQSDLPWVTYYEVTDEFGEANGQDLFDMLCEVHQSLGESTVQESREGNVEPGALARVEAFFADLGLDEPSDYIKRRSDRG